MNVTDQIRLSDLHKPIMNSNMDPEVRDVLIELISRLDLYITGLTTQLKAEPTIYTVNPADNPTDVEGAKSGDVAIYKNKYNSVEVEVIS